jgi:hypothetical protein
MFYKQAEVSAEIIEINKKNMPYLKKTASSKWIGLDDFPKRYQDLVSNYVTANRVQIGTYNPEFKYYRVIALHGGIPNDNGDMWHWGSKEDPDEPELLRFDKGANKQVYQTFIGRGNYKNHNNDDVAKAVGLVLDAAPNEDGKFIEALLAVDTQKDPELIRGIDNNYIDSVSMGCLCAYSICSICGNEARNEMEYCDHIKHHKAQRIYQEGEYKKVYEDNRGVNFIELSWVDVPADRDAKLLEHVASKTISLSENAFIMYSAIKKAMDDAQMVCGGLDDYANLMRAIKQEIEKTS